MRRDDQLLQGVDRHGAAHVPRVYRSRHAFVCPPPASASYRVHSTGVADGGPSARKLAVDVKVRAYPFPIGVFADSLSGNGNVGIIRRASSPTGAS